MTEPLLPIVAILRGVRSAEILDVAAALIEQRIRSIEVPLNSPDPFTTIERLASTYSSIAECGAGTVLTVDDVNRVYASGGRLIVTPNTNVAVIERALALGLHVMPGFGSATEALQAIASGATDLKLFPASTYGVAHVQALRAVLPATIRIFAVGGIDDRNAASWLSNGVDGVGLGGSLYKPGMTAQDVAGRAAAIAASIASARQLTTDN
jgi:2-dehydro-3-deoxyphosphogalactonate aldolase